MKNNKKLLKALLYASMLLTVGGCDKAPTPSGDMGSTAIYEEETSALDYLKEAGIDASLACVDSEGYEYYNLNGYNYKKINDEYLASMLDNINYTEACTPSEFSKYSSKTNVTLDEVKTLINSKDSLNQTDKDILIEALDTLAEKNYYINYDLLYYNVDNLKVKKVSDIQDNPFTSAQLSAAFDVFSQTCYLGDKNLSDYKECLIHELIGHGSTGAYIPGKVVCGLRPNQLAYSDEYGFYGWPCGLAFDEANAEMIALTALNRKENPNNMIAYPFEIYELNTVLASLNISIEEYEKYGVQYIIDKFNELGMPGYDICTIFDGWQQKQAFAETPTPIDYTDLLTNSYNNYFDTLKNSYDQNGISEEEQNNRFQEIDSKYKEYLDFDLGYGNYIGTSTMGAEAYIRVEDLSYNKYLNKTEGKTLTK